LASTSGSRQKNGQTVNNQRKALTETISRRSGWVIADEFADKGISGAKGRDKRPEFDRLLREVVRGKIDVVAAWSVDWLGRSLQDLVGFLGELNSVGCDLYLEKASGRHNHPSRTGALPDARRICRVRAHDHQERIHAGLARARAKGTRSGKPIGRAKDRRNERSRNPWRSGERQGHSEDSARVRDRC
jgi:DNA invertase Pin-like site-specific DNA recombinase